MAYLDKETGRRKVTMMGQPYHGKVINKEITLPNEDVLTLSRQPSASNMLMSPQAKNPVPERIDNELDLEWGFQWKDRYLKEYGIVPQIIFIDDNDIPWELSLSGSQSFSSTSSYKIKVSVIRRFGLFREEPAGPTDLVLAYESPLIYVQNQHDDRVGGSKIKFQSASLWWPEQSPNGRNVLIRFTGDPYVQPESQTSIEVPTIFFRKETTLNVVKLELSGVIDPETREGLTVNFSVYKSWYDCVFLDAYFDVSGKVFVVEFPKWLVENYTCDGVVGQQASIELGAGVLRTPFIPDPLEDPETGAWQYPTLYQYNQGRGWGYYIEDTDNLISRIYYNENGEEVIVRKWFRYVDGKQTGYFISSYTYDCSLSGTIDRFYFDDVIILTPVVNPSSMEAEYFFYGGIHLETIYKTYIDGDLRADANKLKRNDLQYRYLCSGERSFCGQAPESQFICYNGHYEDKPSPDTPPGSGTPEGWFNGFYEEEYTVETTNDVLCLFQVNGQDIYRNEIDFPDWWEYSSNYVDFYEYSNRLFGVLFGINTKVSVPLPSRYWGIFSHAHTPLDPIDIEGFTKQYASYNPYENEIANEDDPVAFI